MHGRPKDKRVALTNLGLSQLRLQQSRLHYHGMCVFAVCNQSLSSQLAQIIALQIFLSLLMGTTETCVQPAIRAYKPSNTLGAMAIKIALLGHYSCYGLVTLSTIWIY